MPGDTLPLCRVCSGEYEVIVGATKVINGDSLLQQFLDDVPREVALRRDTGL